MSSSSHSKASCRHYCIATKIQVLFNDRAITFTYQSVIQPFISKTVKYFNLKLWLQQKEENKVTENDVNIETKQMNDSEEIITEFCVYVAGIMLEFSAKIEYTENFLYILPSICSNKILSHSPLHIQFFHEFLLHSSLNMCLKPHYC